MSMGLMPEKPLPVLQQALEAVLITGCFNVSHLNNDLISSLPLLSSFIHIRVEKFQHHIPYITDEEMVRVMEFGFFLV